jgi:hypothetical protein
MDNREVPRMMQRDETNDEGQKSKRRKATNFSKIPNCFWEWPVSDRAVRVGGIIHTFGWMNDGARPSIDTIATKGRMSRSKAKLAIKELVDAQIIWVEARADGPNNGHSLPNRYHFLPASGVEDPYIKKDRHRSDDEPMHRSESEPSIGLGSDHEVDREQLDTQQEDLGLDRIGTTASGGSSLAASQKNQGQPEDQWSPDPPQGSPTSSQTVSTIKDLGYNEGLVDSEKERLAVDLVDLLENLRTEVLDKPVTTDRHRRDNLKTARLLLEHDGKSASEVHGLLRWAYRDVHWSTRITTLFQLREQYTELLAESQSRRPRRIKQRREPHGSRYRPGSEDAVRQKRSPKDVGFATGADLPGPTEEEKQARRREHLERIARDPRYREKFERLQQSRRDWDEDTVITITRMECPSMSS